MHLRTGEGMYYVFVLGNRQRTELQVHITGDLHDRLSRLEYDSLKGSSAERQEESACIHLLYWEVHHKAEQALTRERELDKWSLRKRRAWISRHNPEWKPLNAEIFAEKHSLPFYRIGNNK